MDMEERNREEIQSNGESEVESYKWC